MVSPRQASFHAQAQEPSISALSYSSQHPGACIYVSIAYISAVGMQLSVIAELLLHGVCTILSRSMETELPRLAPLRPVYDLVLQRGVRV